MPQDPNSITYRKCKAVISVVVEFDYPVALGGEPIGLEGAEMEADMKMIAATDFKDDNVKVLDAVCVFADYMVGTEYTV